MPEGGPFSNVTTANTAAMPATRLYLHGGNYDETLVLKTPMVLKRYGYYRDAGPVVVGR